jgi:membrane protease YdiL (CAAX protease family)
MRSIRPHHPKTIQESELISRAEEDELERARSRVRRGRGSRKENPAKPMTPTEKADALMAGVTLVVGGAIAAFLFFAQPYLNPREAYWLVCDALLLFVPILVICLWFRADLQHFGLTHGDRKLGLKYTAIGVGVMTPILVVISLQPQFRAYYEGMLSQGYMLVGAPIRMPPFVASVTVQPAALAYYEISQGFYLFCWEFFYRGFLLFGLMRSKHINATTAIVLQTIPFTLLHWSIVQGASKPPIEIFSAAIGGLILGWLAYKTRSFIYGFLIHWSIAAILDLLLIVSLMVHPR